jgi:hypothetical protein
VNDKTQDLKRQMIEIRMEEGRKIVEEWNTVDKMEESMVGIVTEVADDEGGAFSDLFL